MNKKEPLVTKKAYHRGYKPVCPYCKEAGIPSKCTLQHSGGGCMCAVYIVPSFDEEGNNITRPTPRTPETRTYKCDNDHTWTVETEGDFWKVYWEKDGERVVYEEGEVPTLVLEEKIQEFENRLQSLENVMFGEGGPA